MLKNLFKIWLILLCIGNITFHSNAQTPWDEVMMGKGIICTALTYENSFWEQYWEGSYLRRNGNIGTFTRQMMMPMVAVGVADNVNIIASLPYIQTAASGGTQVGQSGIQDINVSLKIRWLNRQLGAGRLMLLSNNHFSTPAGNYLSDYMPFSIGFGAPEIGMRGIGAYRMDKGFVFRAGMAYLWRGQTEIERNFYFKNGSVYSPFMNVPHALNIQGAIGYWTADNRLRMEATFATTNCLTGDDIRSYNRPQPTNKTEVTQVGAWVQYYIKADKGLGGLAYFNQTIAGRNMGKATAIGLGLTYQFQAF